MRQLYQDLTTTAPSDLLDLNKPAFQFVSQERFDSCKWPTCILESLSQSIAAYKEKVLQVLSLLLPSLAEGFFQQRGNVFGFGDYNPQSTTLVTQYDMTLLNKAPINNIDAERSVGSINYELDRRGAKQLAAAGSAHFKAKSVDLVELHPAGTFKEYSKKAKNVNKLVQEWQENQLKLQREGMTRKETSQVSCERRRLSDLDKLVSLGGPFTKARQVDDYLKRKRTSLKDKQDRLYTEVRYARDTTLSLPRTSDLFRLREKYQPLPVEKLAKNLKVYLDKASSHASATWQDFDKAVTAVSQNS